MEAPVEVRQTYPDHVGALVDHDMRRGRILFATANTTECWNQACAKRDDISCDGYCEHGHKKEFHVSPPQGRMNDHRVGDRVELHPGYV